MNDYFIPADYLADKSPEELLKLFPKTGVFDHVCPKAQKKAKPSEIVYNEIDCNPGITFQGLKDITIRSSNWVRKALKILYDEYRVARISGGYYAVDPEKRVQKPTGIHGLTIVFGKKLGDMLPPELEAFVKDFFPSEFWERREFKYNRGTENTFYFSCTDNPLNGTELWLLQQALIAFFSSKEMHTPYHSLAKVQYNIDSNVIQIDGYSSLTISNLRSDVLARTYRHLNKNGRHFAREELEVRDLTFEQALDRMSGWMTRETLTRKYERQLAIILQYERELKKGIE